MIMLHAHAGRATPLIGDHQLDDVEGAISPAGIGRSRDAETDEGYRLISVDTTHAPDGCSGGNWFVYRIMQGRNGIRGYRQGTVERVSDDVRSIVSALNGRRATIKPPAKAHPRATRTPATRTPNKDRPK